jgi:hypothetical protein
MFSSYQLSKMSQEYYTRLLQRKRSWTPVKPSNGLVVEGAEDALARALSLRLLEIPVGEFIKDACRKDIPDGSRELLESNIVDEERHDLALSYVADSVKGYLPDYTEEAKKIVKTWEEATEHPILKAMVLERGIFFVILPMFRFLGNVGMRTCSADISRDEQTHVACNSRFCEELGIELTQHVDKLRRATVSWVVQDFNIPDNRWGDKDFWIRQSDNLIYNGVSEELNPTRRSRMPAFFEISAVDLPAYS